MAKFIDKNGEPLSEEELMEASGGVEINPEHHWYGNKYAICNKCKDVRTGISSTALRSTVCRSAARNAAISNTAI